MDKPSPKGHTEWIEPVSQVDRLLQIVDDRGGEQALREGLHMGLVTGIRPDGSLLVRISDQALLASAADFVDRAWVEECFRERQPVIVEASRAGLRVVGALMTRRPTVTRLEGEVVEIVGREAVRIHAGRAVLSLTKDGAVDLFASRVQAVSRGVFRLVGKALRLN